MFEQMQCIIVIHMCICIYIYTRRIMEFYMDRSYIDICYVYVYVSRTSILKGRFGPSLYLLTG